MRRFVLLVILCFFAWVLPASAKDAERELSIACADGKSTAVLRDGNYKTTVKLNSGDRIQISAADGTPLQGIYVIWHSPVEPWTLYVDEGEISCGENGFLHEYIALDTPTKTAELVIHADGMKIAEIRGFSEGEIPGDVQRWEPPCERADILMFASHADDDILFMGGIVPTYGVAENAKVQVVFMTEFWTTAPVREHEKLDGLWADGLKNYPVSADFVDRYSASLKEAQGQYDSEEVTGFMVEQIRRFQPQVIVTHDINGEYGHGYHMLTADCAMQAVEAALSEEKYPDTAAKYGLWNTPKTYLHLFKDNAIRLDLRVPIEEMGGRTALEIAAEAYKKHVSQQGTWFYVSDTNKYSCADFGLWRSLVGVDEKPNMLDHIVLYEEQERIAEETRQAYMQLSKEHVAEIATHVSSGLKMLVEKVNMRKYVMR